MEIEQAKQLRYGQHIYAWDWVRQRTIRLKVNGQSKTWKRQPDKIQIPVKYGLYEYGYITNSNVDTWFTTEEEAEERKIPFGRI